MPASVTTATRSPRSSRASTSPTAPDLGVVVDREQLGRRRRRRGRAAGRCGGCPRRRRRRPGPARRRPGARGRRGCRSAWPPAPARPPLTACRGSRAGRRRGGSTGRTSRPRPRSPSGPATPAGSTRLGAIVTVRSTTMVGVAERDVDGEAHAHRVHRPGRRQQQRPLDAVATQQAPCCRDVTSRPPRGWPAPCCRAPARAQPPPSGIERNGEPGEPPAPKRDQLLGRSSHLTLTCSRQDGAMAHRVLLVDDDRAIRESLARALDLEGYEVLTAADGADGARIAREEHPDVIVLDVMMPSVDGLTVCRVLRFEEDRTPDPHAHRPDRDHRPGRRPRRRRRRLPRQALRPRRAARPAAGPAAPRRLRRPDGCRRRRRARGSADLRVDPAARRVWRGRRRDRPVQDRVRPARAAGAQRRHRARPQHDLRPDLGLRLRARLEEPRRLHQLPAPQARARTASRS